jgi:hypothetical protein
VKKNLFIAEFGHKKADFQPIIVPKTSTPPPPPIKQNPQVMTATYTTVVHSFTQ